MDQTKTALHDHTPAELARRLAREGIIMNVATAWAFLRNRSKEEFPERPETADPAVLPLTNEEFSDLVDELLLHVDSLRSALSRSLVEAERTGKRTVFES
ncbi:MAG: hypothetical protein ACR2PL_16110 [Dehalococcoidia bacterium]